MTAIHVTRASSTRPSARASVSARTRRVRPETARGATGVSSLCRPLRYPRTSNIARASGSAMDASAVLPTSVDAKASITSAAAITPAGVLAARSTSKRIARDALVPADHPRTTSGQYHASADAPRATSRASATIGSATSRKYTTFASRAASCSRGSHPPRDAARRPPSPTRRSPVPILAESLRRPNGGSRRHAPRSRRRTSPCATRPPRRSRPAAPDRRQARERAANALAGPQPSCKRSRDRAEQR